ncbi:MAG TPA: hypothetical protein VFA38_03710, partial [Nitrospirales bacterium]|nr:hypothetical protein [Nitrospirales bacterium]
GHNLFMLALWLAMTASASAFTLTEPKANARVTPGARIPAAVEAGRELGIGTVRFYWYRDDQEPLLTQQATPALITSAAATPPYGGTLPVPADAIGMMRLLAVGEIVQGRLAGREEFDEIVVQAEPEAALTRIEFETEKPMRLDTLAKVTDVPAVGYFADGVTRPLYGAGTGSEFQSSDANVAEVSADGKLRVRGDGDAVITVRNRGQQGTLRVVVKTNGEPNTIPIANAGPDITVRAGSKVVLNGLQSVDPDGDPLRYEWTQVRGHKVSLLDYDAPKATFMAPVVSRKRLLRFRLRVTDMTGPDTVKGADSTPAYVNVWVEP